jgi:HPt (histidine-containing phosphotransfer) domain-containing protein
MAPSKPKKPAVASFDDHDVITPPNKLSGALARGAAGDDPVARAEAALAQLSSEFSNWMEHECEQLDQARNRVREAGMAAQEREALFRAAHDIKGQAVTLGFPLVADVAGSLCRLIEETRDPRRIPFALVDQHVNAVRAIVREHAHPHARAVAEKLTISLREVSEEFLRREGKDALPPGGVPSPPLAPGK